MEFLKEYQFPIEVRPVTVPDGIMGSNYQLPTNYKSIIRADTNEVISIVKSSYKLVKNEDLIDILLEELTGLSTPYTIRKTHSFCDNKRMRLEITFPELTMHDENSQLELSLYLHNSYDLSESVRMRWGFFRLICSNGAILGKILAQTYSRHTKGFKIANLKQSLTETYDRIPAIQNRIKHLESAPVTADLMDRVENQVGKKLSKTVFEQNPETQWQMYNALTNYISHIMDQRFRARYQLAIAHAFQL
ncbi:DUF932 domain-containing protein [Candidatus Marinimicrobia bacterium MT.SAG.2]|nr:DUF932 domain-containing protein [Candidatus Marinimicrobia bacterium MT.SAG.2]